MFFLITGGHNRGISCLNHDLNLLLLLCKLVKDQLSEIPVMKSDKIFIVVIEPHTENPLNHYLNYVALCVHPQLYWFL